jgi:hypothetical protein
VATGAPSQISPVLNDDLMDLYVEWRQECIVVRNAHVRWSSSPVAEQESAFAAYRAALDREERATAVYADRLQRISRGVDHKTLRTAARPPRVDRNATRAGRLMRSLRAGSRQVLRFARGATPTHDHLRSRLGIIIRRDGRPGGRRPRARVSVRTACRRHRDHDARRLRLLDEHTAPDGLLPAPKPDLDTSPSTRRTSDTSSRR